MVLPHVPHTADSGQQIGQNTSAQDEHKKQGSSLFFSQKHIYKKIPKYKKIHFYLAPFGLRGE